MPPARSGERTGRQRGLSTDSEAQEGQFTTGSIWGLISSLRVANDELKDLLSQERAPLPLLPDIMGMAEVSSSSRRTVDAVDTASQRDMVLVDSPISEPYLQEEEAYHVQTSPEQQTPQTSGCLFKSYSDYQALFDSIGLLDGRIDPSLVDQQGEFEDFMPGMIGMADASPRSTRRAVDAIDTASQRETVRSTNSWNIQQSNSDQLDSPISEPRPSPERQASQTSSSLSKSYSDQVLFDSINLFDSHLDPALVEQPQGEIEDRDELDEAMADLLRDTSNVTSDKTAGTETRCWEHGCKGRRFSTRSNLLRHQIEKGKARPNFKCPTCGAFFSRTTARNQHVAKKSCNRVRRYSNGRERPGPRVIDEI